MRWVRRILGGVAVLVAVVLVAVAAAGVVAVRRSFPETDGDLAVAGLRGPVTVERDADGVPTIVAGSTHDLFLAQGFVHAQDRFWEMDFRRHVTAGRLSELFGAGSIDTDRFIRTLGWRRVAEQEVELLDEPAREMLASYAAGVNAWMDGRTGTALSFEHALLPLTGATGYRPEPWTEVDSLAWLKAMAWDLRSNLNTELERGRLMLADLGPGRSWEDLFPGFDATTYPTILPWGGAVVDGEFVPASGAAADPTGVPASAVPVTTAASPAAVVGVGADPAAVARALDASGLALAASPDLLGDASSPGIGSNSWVIAPERSATGGALLANDPHLGPAQPSLWYQVRLRCAPVSESCPYDVAGYSFSGMPGIIIGHNADVAWAFTNLGPDVADLVVERIEGDTVLTETGPVPVEVRTETIRVAGGDDVTHTVRTTPNGPVFSDVSSDAAELGAGPLADDAGGTEEYAVALRWTALEPGRTANAVPGLMAARDFASFRRAAADFEVPSQNLLYADREGNIAYQAPGRIPVRAGHDGTVPVPGWTGVARWERYLAFDELPYTLNPSSGMIVTANQLVLPPGSSPFLHVDVSAGQRGGRIVELLEGRDDLTLDDLELVQLDNHNTKAATLVPFLLAVRSDEAAVTTMQELLAGWDLQDDADSAAAAAFNATWRAVLARTFHDELPEWAWPAGGGRWMEVVRGLLDEPDAAWWHDDTLTQRRTRDDVLLLALADAHAELTELLGEDPEGWRWGALHTLTLTHASFGTSGIAPIERLFNRGPLETSGGSDVVNANAWTAVDGYEVVWVPSMRMLMDLSDLDAGRWIHLTGQSGRPFHRHYADQAERWRDGGYAPMAFTPAATAESAESTLTLRPTG